MADVAGAPLPPDLSSDAAVSSRLKRQPDQARGERRVEALLVAAAEVIAADGLAAATIQAIAQRAGASVGALYHFFPSREALLDALSARYVDQLRQITRAHEARDAARWATMSPAELADTLLAPYVSFIAQHPAYVALAATRADSRVPTDADFEERGARLVESIFKVRWPKMKPAARVRAAQALMAMSDGIIVAIGRGGVKVADELFPELARAMAAYIGSYDSPDGDTHGSRRR